MRLGTHVRTALGAALLLRVGTADASGAKTSSLSWVRLPGAERCVATQPLARAVEERLGRAVFVSASDAEVSVEGRVEPASRGYRATIALRDAQGKDLGKRELASEGADCAGLTEPLALVIAVMIDPDAALGPKPPPPSTAPPPAEPKERVVVRTETERVLVPVLVPVPPPHLRADLGAGGRLAFGVVPGVGLGVSASALLAPARFVGLEGHASYLAPSAASAEGGSVDFSHAEVGVGVCPLVVVEGRLLFSACGLADLGATFARPQGFDRNVNEVRATVGLGLGARASLQLVGPFALRAGVTSSAPLLRPSFELTGKDGVPREVFRQSPVTFAADFGVGATFR